MSFNTEKRVFDNSYEFLYPEKLYSEYVEKEVCKIALSSNFAFHDPEELDAKIRKAFGEPNFVTEHSIFIHKEGKMILDERAYIYDDFILCFKNKLFYSNYFSESEIEEELQENKQEAKFKIKLNLFGCRRNDKQEKKLNEGFLSLMSKDYEDKRKESELSILCHNAMDGFSLKNVKTLGATVDIHSNYNEGFEDVSNYILERLSSKNDKGLVLLHGLPGTGKTSYIRHLTKAVKDKPIIYIPPDFACNIANPDFVAFFLDYANSILIIEDAENILRSRKSGGNQSVANLLSISDGLLGDGLKLQIICTFNADISEIDEALLREGRLIAEYKFDKLSVEKTQSLLNAVYKKDNEEAPIVNKEMTLAQIFNHKDKRFVSKKDSQIGFRKNY